MTYSERRILLYSKVVGEVPSLQRKRFLYSWRELCRFEFSTKKTLYSSFGSTSLSMVFIHVLIDKQMYAGKYIPELAEVVYDNNNRNSSLHIKLKGILVCLIFILHTKHHLAWLISTTFSCNDIGQTYIIHYSVFILKLTLIWYLSFS